LRACWARCSKICSLIRLRESQVGFGQLQVGARLVECVLEGSFIDGEQQIALLDHLTVLEMHLIEIPRYPRPDFDRVDGNEASDIFILIDDCALYRRGHGHLGRRSGPLLLTLAASHKQPCRSDQGGEGRRM